MIGLAPYATSRMPDPDNPQRLLAGLTDPFRQLIDSVQDYAIFLLDRGGHVVSWNPGAQKIKGYSAAEILGRHLSVFYPQEANDKQWPQEELRRAEKLGRFEDEGWRLRKDGSRFWANVVITAIRGDRGEILGFAKITRDLSERRMQEESLRQIEADRRRIEVLEKTEKQTNEFLAMLAHELRNPLAPIRNALHLLEKKPTTDPAELWVREVLHRQTVQMTRLVDDLLDVSRVTRSTVALSKAVVDVRKAVREAADGSTQWIQARHHHLEIKLPEEKLEVVGDAVRLNQIVQNLLHNAAKFTPEHGRIEVAARRSGNEILVSVKDNGIGMTPELAKSAFELFRQGEQGIERAEGGLGVGLTLVERLVSAHQGRVEAISEGPGKGSEFVVHLPARTGAAAASPRPVPDEEMDGQGRRILVVDDNLDAANALRYLLQNDGHEVKVSTDGALGLALAKEFRPEVLLLDIGLPRLSGYEIAKLVRADPTLTDVTIIAITGYGQAQDRARTTAAGFDHHLTKPVEYRALQRLLRVAT